MILSGAADYLADEVAVMYAGKIVEQAPVSDLFRNPSHPYTRGLFASLPSINTDGDRLATITGNVPPAYRFPSGCRFHPRCPEAFDRCGKEIPPSFEIGADHTAACWLCDPEAKA